MSKINLSKTELLEQYNTHIDNILDECDWKTHFDGLEICGIICHILKINGNPEYPSLVVHQLYMDKIDSLNLATGEWGEKYGRTEIISMIYDIIESI